MKNIYLRYTGQRKSYLSGDYLLGNGYRNFNPILKRFMSQDNMSPFGVGGENGYIYCSNDPVNDIDVSGHGPVVDWLLFDVFDGLIEGFFEDATSASVTDAIVSPTGSANGLSRDMSRSMLNLFSAAASGGNNNFYLLSQDVDWFWKMDTGYVRNISGSRESALVIHGARNARTGHSFGLMAGVNPERTTTVFCNPQGLMFKLQEWGCDISTPRDTRLHLISCYSGNSLSAQQLADCIGRTVVSYGDHQSMLYINTQRLKKIKLNNKGFITIWGGGHKLTPHIHYPKNFFNFN